MPFSSVFNLIVTKSVVTNFRNTQEFIANGWDFLSEGTF